MLFSQIKMYQKGGMYKCQIKHDGKVVEGVWCQLAPSAYKSAECKLIYAPGYVQSVPLSDYM